MSISSKSETNDKKPKRQCLIDDNAEAFSEQLLGDIFGCFITTMKIEVTFLKERDKKVLPDDFYLQILAFSKPFIDSLGPEMVNLPVKLLYSEDLFKRFANSVCLKLIGKADDSEVGFLKVMTFLVIITGTSFIFRCYRIVDDTRAILYKLLKNEDHIESRFFEEEGGFDVISLRCQLAEDPDWCKSAIEEMRTCINDSLKEELEAKSRYYEDPSEPDRSKIKLTDVKLQADLLRSNENHCPYCNVPCELWLKAFWEPKIKYKPERALEWGQM